MEYKDALKKSDYNFDMNYTKNKSEKPRKQKQNILLFKKSVSRNVTEIFLQFITKHFPKKHKFCKHFNSNAVKASYSSKNYGSKNNVKQIISRDTIKKSDRNHVIKGRNVMAEKKENAEWKETVKLIT